MCGKEVVDKFQYRKVVGLEYSFGLGEMKINMKGTTHNYYSKLDEVEINPKNLDLNSIEINNNRIHLKFSKPINCNVDSGRYVSTMMCGTELDGKNKDEFVERLDGLADKLGMLRDESVIKKKEEIRQGENNE